MVIKLTVSLTGSQKVLTILLYHDSQFLSIVLRRQYNYVLTSLKEVSDWLKISRRFCWAPSIQNRNFKISRQKAARNVKYFAV